LTLKSCNTVDCPRRLGEKISFSRSRDTERYLPELCSCSWYDSR